LALKIPISSADAEPSANAGELSVARLIPSQIRRREVEMRLVLEGSGGPAARADLALLKAVARARQWSEDMPTGRAQSVDELAERKGVGSRYFDDC
jgi:hypothetical protein